MDQLRIGVGDGLEMDVAAKVMLFPQDARDFYQLLHRMVGALHDTRGEEQPLDVVAAVEAQGEVDDLLRRKPRAPHVRALAVDAIVAIEHAVVGEQDLEQGDAPPVRRIGVADAHPFGRAHALASAAIALRRPGRGARGVIFCCIGKDFELLEEGELSHLFFICSPVGFA